MYYTYDGNGNVTRISDKAGDGQNSSNSNSDTFNPPFDTGANTGWAGVAYGREPGGGGGNEQSTQYEWDEENRLIHAKVNGNEIDFLYNAGGERTAKYGKDGEVIYYDKMFQVKTNVSPLHITKHIFLGSARVVSKLSHELGPIDLEYEKRNAYYYHGDHLGSSNYLTDYEGNEYEHYEYTPFGEMWVEEESDSLDKITFKFTSKELDEETGLYYFGARYLDAKASRWLSCDPLGPNLINPKRKNYSIIESTNLYSYCSNNPIIFVDPTGLKEHKTKMVTGTTLDGEQFTYTAKYKNKKDMALLQNIIDNMNDLGWDVQQYDLIVKKGIFGKEKITGIAEVNQDGSTGNWLKGATLNKIMSGGIDITSEFSKIAKFLKPLKDAYNTISFGIDMYKYLKEMNEKKDPISSLNYILTKKNGAKEIQAWLILEPNYQSIPPGSSEEAFKGAFNATFANDIHRLNFYYKPLIKMMQSTATFVY